MAARCGRAPSAGQRAQWASDRQAKLADLHRRIVAEVATLTTGVPVDVAAQVGRRR